VHWQRGGSSLAQAEGHVDDLKELSEFRWRG